jgi:hypothetical protein
MPIKKNKYEKIIFPAMIAAMELLASQTMRAQGTLYVSNLDQTPTGSATLGSDSWIAQAFITGTNSGGYVLNSVQLLMDAASGNPGGFAVSIYNSSISNPLSPESSIGSLSGPDPSTGGIFTYTASSLAFSPSTLYFVVVTTASSVAQGAYTWSAATDGPQSGVNHWSIFGVYDTSADGLNWETYRNFDFQLGIYATAIPEPSAVSLLLLGGLCFLHAPPAKIFTPNTGTIMKNTIFSAMVLAMELLSSSFVRA